MGYCNAAEEERCGGAGGGRRDDGRGRRWRGVKGGEGVEYRSGG